MKNRKDYIYIISFIILFLLKNKFRNGKIGSEEEMGIGRQP
jgi:hypothetical protein